MSIFFKAKKKSENFENHLIDYLNSKNIYSNPIELLLTETVELLNIEGDWKGILSNKSRKERVYRTIQLWEEYITEFSIIIDVFKKKLISIDSILYQKEIHVVYTLKDYDGVIYYLGKLPKVLYENSIINRFPIEIQNFYHYIHDGFVSFPSESMGLICSDNLYCLGEDLLQSEFLKDYSVKDTYMIYSNGGGDGIVYDLSKDLPKGFTYFHDSYDDCDFDHNPIDVMCTWMKLGINHN